tara:strand:- start:577 stop:804 length:228 start_codon:yes stop_codon:yes gene_type:complete
VLSNLYIVDIIIGDGMVTVEENDFLKLIDKLLELYDRHDEDFNLMRATAYWDGGEVADVKLKVLETIKQRRHNAS